MCCASVFSACISASIITVFDSELILCVSASSSSEIMSCAQCSFFASNITVFDFVFVSCAR